MNKENVKPAADPYERDTRPQKGAWAPGHYFNNCVKCNKQFIGDKRALNCADCAYDTKG